MDATGFRAAFPAFGDRGQYLDERVNFWLTIGAKRLSAERWDDLLDQGLGLFVAHNLTLEMAASLDAAGVGGMSVAAGPVTSESKSVGPVSKSKGTTPGVTAWANGGSWNATIYGQQLFELMQIVGAGGLQV